MKKPPANGRRACYKQTNELVLWAFENLDLFHSPFLEPNIKRFLRFYQLIHSLLL